VTDPDRAVRIGETRSPSAWNRAVQDHFAAREQANGRDQGQRWFDGNPDEAKRLLRELLGPAQRAVRFIDPYFDVAAFRDVALAVGRWGVPIQILAAEQGLRQKATSGTSKSDKSQGAILLQQFEMVTQSDPSVAVEIRVSLGRDAPIHDRFLCIDDAIWMVGSSFNSFGERGSMILRLPAPSLVRPVLDAAWADSKPLREYLVSRGEL
jgi:hypothetical protein